MIFFLKKIPLIMVILALSIYIQLHLSFVGHTISIHWTKIINQHQKFPHKLIDTCIMSIEDSCTWNMKLVKAIQKQETLCYCTTSITKILFRYNIHRTCLTDMPVWSIPTALQRPSIDIQSMLNVFNLAHKTRFWLKLVLSIFMICTGFSS